MAAVVSDERDRNPVISDAIQGAYVDLPQLTRLRWRPLREPKVRRQRSRDVGARAARLRGRGMDFEEVRPYQPGDDARSIDWRVTARKSRPHTKVYKEEKERPTLVVVDQTQSMFFGSRVRLKSVAGAELAALAAWRTLERNDRIGGVVVGNDQGHFFKPQRSAKALVRFLAEVTRQNRLLDRSSHATQRGIDATLLSRIAAIARTNHHVYIISDFAFADEAWFRELYRIARHNSVTALHVYDPLERRLPPADVYTMTDGTKRWHFDSGNVELARQYETRFDARRQHLADTFARQSIAFVSIATDEPSQIGLAW